MSGLSSTVPSTPSSSSSPSSHLQSHKQWQTQPPTKCHTCRRRRVQCDFTRPACLKCTSRNIPCGGYSAQKPLVWLAGGGKQNEYIREEAGVPKALRRGRKKGRPKMEVIKDGEDEWPAVEKKDRKKSSTKELAVRSDLAQDGFCIEVDGASVRFPAPLGMKYPVDVKTMVSTLWYFNEKLYPDMDPFICNIAFHSMDPKRWQDGLSDIIWCVLFTVVESHKAIQTHSYPYNPRTRRYNDQNKDNRAIIKKEIYGYKCRAFGLLNEELRRPETQLADTTLAYVLSLLLTETQLSAVGAWYAHFQGAAQIIKLRGGVRAIFKQCPWLEKNLKYFMLSDVKSATANSGLSLTDVERQLGYRSLIEELYDDGSGTCAPCPNELFDSIIQINCFRAEIANDNLKTDISRPSVSNILQEILSFSASKWATRMTNRYAKQNTILDKIKMKPGFIRPTQDDWLRIGGAYHAAVLLYCIRNLALDFDEQLRVSFPGPTGISESAATHKPGMTSYVTVQDIQLVARHTLTDHIRAIFNPSPSQPSSNLNRTPTQRPLGKTIIWPLFIAGIEAAVDFSSFDPPSRHSSSSPNESLDLVCNALCMLSRDIGTLNLLDAVAFLTREWEGNCERWWIAQELGEGVEPACDVRWWDEIMEGLPGRAAFFM